MARVSAREHVDDEGEEDRRSHGEDAEDDHHDGEAALFLGLCGGRGILRSARLDLVGGARTPVGLGHGLRARGGARRGGGGRAGGRARVEGGRLGILRGLAAHDRLALHLGDDLFTLVHLRDRQVLARHRAVGGRALNLGVGVHAALTQHVHAGLGGADR